MTISNILAKRSHNTETQPLQGKRLPANTFENMLQEEVAALPADRRTATRTKAASAESALDSDRHINTFIQQALAHAPESEKKIWAQMKEDLGI